MAALGLWDMQNQSVTNAGGALLFLDAPQNWLPGAYMHLARFSLGYGF